MVELVGGGSWTDCGPGPIWCWVPVGRKPWCLTRSEWVSQVGWPVSGMGGRESGGWLVLDGIKICQAD